MSRAKTSLPARGVWIEIRRTCSPPRGLVSLPARGVWIEIIIASIAPVGESRRSPQGECGLK